MREVPELQVGDNTVTTDAQTVEYTYAGTTEYWNGHVYQFTVPDVGTYAVGLKYTGTDLDTFKSMELDLYSSDENGDNAGYINNVSTNNYDKMDVLTSNLENGKPIILNFNTQSIIRRLQKQKICRVLQSS